MKKVTIILIILFCLLSLSIYSQSLSMLGNLRFQTHENSADSKFFGGVSKYFGMEGGINLGRIEPLTVVNPLVPGSHSLSKANGFTYSLTTECVKSKVKGGNGIAPDWGLSLKLTYLEYIGDYDWLFTAPVGNEGLRLKVSYYGIPLTFKYCLKAKTYEFNDVDRITITDKEIQFHEGRGAYQSQYAIYVYGGPRYNYLNKATITAGSAVNTSGFDEAAKGLKVSCVGVDAGLQFCIENFYLRANFYHGFGSVYTTSTMTMDGPQIYCGLLF